MIVTGSLKTIVQVQVVSLENLLPPVQVNAHAPSLARPFGITWQPSGRFFPQA
jgi:hypothetical protein